MAAVPVGLTRCNICNKNGAFTLSCDTAGGRVEVDRVLFTVGNRHYWDLKSRNKMFHDSRCGSAWEKPVKYSIYTLIVDFIHLFEIALSQTIKTQNHANLDTWIGINSRNKTLGNQHRSSTFRFYSSCETKRQGQVFPCEQKQISLFKIFKGFCWVLRVLLFSNDRKFIFDLFINAPNMF